MPTNVQEARSLTPLSPAPPEITARPQMVDFEGHLSALVTMGALAHRERIARLVERVAQTPAGRQLLGELRELAAQGSVPAIALETDIQGGADAMPVHESAVVRLKMQTLQSEAIRIGVPPEVEHAPGFFLDLIAVRDCLMARGTGAMGAGHGEHVGVPLEPEELLRTFRSELQESLASEGSHPGRDRSGSFVAIPENRGRALSDEGSPPDATPETCAPLHPYAATTERAPASGSRRSGRLRASMRWLGRRVRQLGQLFARQGRITQTADRESTRPGSQTISTSGNPLAARADNLPTFRALTPGQEDTISAPVVRTRTWTVSQTTKTAARPTVPDVVPAEAAPLLHPGPQPRRHRRSPSGVNPAGLAADPTPTIPEED